MLSISYNMRHTNSPRKHPQHKQNWLLLKRPFREIHLVARRPCLQLLQVQGWERTWLPIHLQLGEGEGLMRNRSSVPVCLAVLFTLTHTTLLVARTTQPALGKSFADGPKLFPRFLQVWAGWGWGPAADPRSGSPPSQAAAVVPVPCLGIGEA